MQIHLATAAGYQQQGLLVWNSLGEKATKMLPGSTEFQPVTLAIWIVQMHSQTDFLLHNPRPKLWGCSNSWVEWILPRGATNKFSRAHAIWWAGTDVSLLCTPCMCRVICTVWVVPSCHSRHRFFHLGVTGPLARNKFTISAECLYLKTWELSRWKLQSSTESLVIKTNSPKMSYFLCTVQINRALTQ